MVSAPCSTCKMVNFCQDCRLHNSQAVQLHEKVICFSITEPTTMLERFVAYCVGGLGAVHQRVTSLPFEDKEINDLYTDREVLHLNYGVQYNDFPTGDEADGDKYASTVLERIEAPAAPYLTDPRFRFQPRKEIRWAMAAVYKRTPHILMHAFGVNDAAVQSASAMLKRRETETHYHFMRSYASEPDLRVVRRASETAANWYGRALAENNTFVLGHLFHMLEDSYSEAHTDRDSVTGALRRIYFFGDQTDKSHSSHESYAAITESSAKRRVELVVEVLKLVLKSFADDRKRISDLVGDERIGMAHRLADNFKDSILLEKAFSF